jgi:ATP phosphoribosyltransferase
VTIDGGRLTSRSRDRAPLAGHPRLLRSAGFRIQEGKNELAARIENFPLDLMLVRDDDIPTFVADGVCEFGVVGRNVLEESRLEDGMAPVEVVARSASAAARSGSPRPSRSPMTGRNRSRASGSRPPIRACSRASSTGTGSRRPSSG